MPDNELAPSGDASAQQTTPAKESRVGHWIAVFAAIVAAAAAIYSSILAARTAESTTRAQSHSDAVQAERQEKREAYGNYLHAVMGLDRVSFAINEVLQNAEIDTTRLRTVIDDPAYKEAWDNLLASEGAISLVDSPEVEEARLALVSSANTIGNLIDLHIKPATENPSASVILRRLSNEYYGDFAGFRNGITAFEKAAKLDLDSLGYGEN
ncbi:hypothetical protein [Mycolicibacterium fortuitum]|uniref:hypothetical protein n=1 Tax=Mycolicibacterium fortuitum TaxID=1766 RepID=UPI00104250F7|nr:hypothetical protein [Mycolicibacterium fortuitum]